VKEIERGGIQGCRYILAGRFCPSFLVHYGLTHRCNSRRRK
jgi:hypothetical protein